MHFMSQPCCSTNSKLQQRHCSVLSMPAALLQLNAQHRHTSACFTAPLLLLQTKDAARLCLFIIAHSVAAMVATPVRQSISRL
jgi:hypothetical protein